MTKITPTILLLSKDEFVIKLHKRLLRDLFSIQVALMGTDSPAGLLPFLPTAVLLITGGFLGQGHPNGVKVIGNVRLVKPELKCLLYTSDGSVLTKLHEDANTVALLKPASNEQLFAAIRGLVPELFIDDSTN